MINMINGGQIPLVERVGVREGQGHGQVLMTPEAGAGGEFGLQDRRAKELWIHFWKRLSGTIQLQYSLTAIESNRVRQRSS